MNPQPTYRVVTGQVEVNTSEIYNKRSEIVIIVPKVPNQTPQYDKKKVSWSKKKVNYIVGKCGQRK